MGRMECGALVLSVALVSFSNLAFATLGGPEFAEILGWDPLEKKIYFLLIDKDEGGYPPGLVYFDLGGRNPARAIHVPWSRSIETDSRRRIRQTRRLEMLKRRLKPLKLETAPSIPFSRVISVDTVSVHQFEGPRFRVWLDLGAEWRTFEVTAYRDPCVSVPRLYTIPGRQERIAVLAFIGRPEESGYEVQVPVFLEARRPESLRVEWKPWFP